MVISSLLPIENLEQAGVSTASSSPGTLTFAQSIGLHLKGSPSAGANQPLTAVNSKQNEAAPKRIMTQTGISSEKLSPGSQALHRETKLASSSTTVDEGITLAAPNQKNATVIGNFVTPEKEEVTGTQKASFEESTPEAVSVEAGYPTKLESQEIMSQPIVTSIKVASKIDGSLKTEIPKKNETIKTGQAKTDNSLNTVGSASTVDNVMPDISSMTVTPRAAFPVSLQGSAMEQSAKSTSGADVSKASKDIVRPKGETALGATHVDSAEVIKAPSQNSSGMQETASDGSPLRKTEQNVANSTETAQVPVQTIAAHLGPIAEATQILPSVAFSKTDTGAIHAEGGPGMMCETGLQNIGAASLTGTAPQILTATNTRLEVGIESGAHGWLTVRAEMADGGAVHATMSAASSAGQQMLERELPQITSFLQQEHIAVSSVAVHSASSGLHQGAEMQAGGHQEQSNAGARGQQGGAKQSEDAERRASGNQDWNEEGDHTASVPYAIGDGWLSVRA